MSKKEEKLARKAKHAMAKLARYRQRHAVEARAAAAVEDITVTMRLCGWSVRDARKGARRLLAAGVTPAAAARLFNDSEGLMQ
jgi:hypothetical protein